MRCPFCSCVDTRVIDSRLVGEGDQIRRRRECTECKERFTSYESAELNYPRIIKSDNRREQFNEVKLRSGIMRALEKRPVEMERVELAISRVTHKLRAAGEREVKARKLGDWVMEELRTIDQVAYVRFASVYHSFEDVRAFLEEIERLEHVLPPEIKKDQLDLLPGDNDSESKKS
jgi:transcriptional repressor NrdR